MKIITDKAKIDGLIEREGVLQYFDTPDLNFKLFLFDKGEIVTYPDRALDHFLFMVEGGVQIYDILPDGSKSIVNFVKAPIFFGDKEYCRGGVTPYYLETTQKSMCLALPIEENRETLSKDVKFLHLVLDSLYRKFLLFQMISVEAQTVEEKVLYYMREISKEPGYISNLNQAMGTLRCSRRQLQRVLAKLSDEGVVERVGKGRYKIID